MCLIRLLEWNINYEKKKHITVSCNGGCQHQKQHFVKRKWGWENVLINSETIPWKDKKTQLYNIDKSMKNVPWKDKTIQINNIDKSMKMYQYLEFTYGRDYI